MQCWQKCIQVGRRGNGSRSQDCALFVHHPGFDLRAPDIDSQHHHGHTATRPPRGVSHPALSQYHVLCYRYRATNDSFGTPVLGTIYGLEASGSLRSQGLVPGLFSSCSSLRTGSSTRSTLHPSHAESLSRSRSRCQKQSQPPVEKFSSNRTAISPSSGTGSLLAHRPEQGCAHYTSGFEFRSVVPHNINHAFTGHVVILPNRSPAEPQRAEYSRSSIQPQFSANTNR